MRDLEFNISAKDRTGPGFDSAEARAKRFNSQLDNTAAGMNLAATAAKAFAGAFTLTAIENFARVVKGVITQAADLVDVADKVGVATGELQRLTYGFELAGVASADVDQILTQWSKRIGEAYTHGGRLAEILKANGVSLTNSEGRLRSSVDLMRSYAELVASAGSEQERMTLATIAFGKAGSSMVLALRDGTAGFDELMRAADDAGGVLDDKLLRRAAEIDDEFNRIWRNFEINSKNAILTAVNGIDDMLSIMRRGQENRNIEALGTYIGSLAGTTGTIKGDRLQTYSERRIDGAFSFDPIESGSDLARMLRERYGKQTVIPNEPAERKAAAAAAREQESAYDRVVKALGQERDLIGLSTTEQRIANELRKAGVSLATEEGRAIAAKVAEIEKEKAAQATLIEQTNAMKSAAASFITTFRQDMQSGQGALAAFGNAFSGLLDSIETKIEERFASSLVDKLLASTSNSGMGWLGGLFGASAFRPNTTLGGFIGAYASGTESAAGGWSIVGEEGPELMKVPRASAILSADRTADALSSARSQPPMIINFHLTTPDVEGFRRSESQIAARMRRVVALGQRNN